MSTKNKNLFKEAIAEAKEIREAALINAKQTIEEAFTPKIQEMFDSKLAEMEDEDQALDVSPQGEEDLDEDFDLSSILAELDEEDNQIAENYDEEGLDEKKEPKDDKEPKEPKDSKPKTPAKPKEPKEPKEPGLDGNPEDEDLDVSDLSVKDLVKLVKDIIAQETGAPGGEDDNIDLDSNPEDNLDSMGGPGAESSNDDPFGAGTDDEELDEDFNLEELLGELDGLGAEDDMNEVSRLRAENKDLRSDLNEALKTIKTTSSALRESNLVNAKLKRISSILKEGQLNTDQKTKVIAAFDKATNIKEVNLVFESLKTNMLVKKTSSIRESLFRNSSSKPVGNSTKKTIVDVDAQMARMQKLANIR